jgi:hypothetical protein
MKMKNMKKLLLALLCIAPLFAVGCEDLLNDKYMTAEKKQHGIIYILPGIQGVDSHYTNIRDGLIGSGINCAIKIHPWGCQIPGINLMVNETDVTGDREWGGKIAQEIMMYQREYPGRPVYIIGQSGGAGVAVFTAEHLADGGAAIQGLVLLDGSVSSVYDLSTALRACQKGIVNFYNPDDVVLLQAGTAMWGNVDGGHGDSAGRVGFSGNFGRLYQVEISKDMIDDFADPHFADCSKAFSAQYISPWIIDMEWPPGHMHAPKKR